MENRQSEIKAIKLGKKCGTTYCLGYEDYTDNFKPQEVKMTNKVVREKSKRVVCRFGKSRFLKKTTQQQKIIQRQHKSSVCTFLNTNKKAKIVVTICKTCKFIAKTVINTH